MLTAIKDIEPGTTVVTASGNIGVLIQCYPDKYVNVELVGIGGGVIFYPDNNSTGYTSRDIPVLPITEELISLLKERLEE